MRPRALGGMAAAGARSRGVVLHLGQRPNPWIASARASAAGGWRGAARARGLLLSMSMDYYIIVKNQGKSLVFIGRIMVY
jgi:hypothetical protein